MTVVDLITWQLQRHEPNRSISATGYRAGLAERHAIGDIAKASPMPDRTHHPNIDTLGKITS